MELNSPITALGGVGAKRAALYAKLGIATVGDLLEHYPRRYLDLTGNMSIAEASTEAPCAVRATVTAKSPVKLVRRGLTVAKVRATDMTQDLLITFFNAKYTVDSLEVGKEYIFFGDFVRRISGGEMNSPSVLSAEESGFMPQYPLTEGLSSKMVTTQMKAALAGCIDRVPETLSTAVLKKYDLCSKGEALCSIHFPKSAADLERARRRVIFEELFDFSLAMSVTKGKARSANGRAFSALSTAAFEEKLGFEFTGAQK